MDFLGWLLGGSTSSAKFHNSLDGFHARHEEGQNHAADFPRLEIPSSTGPAGETGQDDEPTDNLSP